MGSLLTSI